MCKAFAARVLAFAAALCACGAGCGGGSDAPRRTVEAISLAGSADFTGTPAFDIAVDPGRRLVYVSGGMGQTDIVRIYAADPANMTSAAFAPGFGGGVAVDPVTGRVASTDGFGGNLGVFEPSGVMYDAVPIGICGGALASGDGGLFGVSTQCVPDRFHIYDPGSRSIIFQTASGGVASSVVFNAATGRWYQNRTPRGTPSGGGPSNPLVIEPAGGGGFTTADFPIDGFLWAADPARNRLWFAEPSTGGAPLLLDGTTHARIGPTAVTVGGSVAIATSIGAAWHNGSDGRIRLLDAESGALIDSFDFAAATGGLSNRMIASDGERAYVVGVEPSGATRLFVFAPARRVR